MVKKYGIEDPATHQQSSGIRRGVQLLLLHIQHIHPPRGGHHVTHVPWGAAPSWQETYRVVKQNLDKKFR